MARKVQPGEPATATSASNVEAFKVSERKTDEIIFAMVGPIGSGVSFTAAILARALEQEYGYSGRRLS